MQVHLAVLTPSEKTQTDTKPGEKNNLMASRLSVHINSIIIGIILTIIEKVTINCNRKALT